jgi:putative salt-induced outer membrane protein YdiY
VLVIPDRGEVFDSSTGLRLAMTDRVDSNFRVDLQHETDPPDGSEKTDVTYSIGVGVKF